MFYLFVSVKSDLLSYFVFSLSLSFCSGFSPKPQNGNTNGRLLTSVSLVKVQKLISRSPGATQLIGITKEAGQPVLDVAADVVSSG